MPLKLPWKNLGMRRKRNRRSSISLPKQQTSVTKKAELGNTSRSEFIKEAVRLRIENTENQIHEKERKT